MYASPGQCHTCFSYSVVGRVVLAEERQRRIRVLRVGRGEGGRKELCFSYLCATVTVIDKWHSGRVYQENDSLSFFLSVEAC